MYVLLSHACILYYNYHACVSCDLFHCNARVLLTDRLSEREKQYRMQRRHYDEELRHLRALLQRKQREVDTLSKSKR